MGGISLLYYSFYHICFRTPILCTYLPLTSSGANPFVVKSILNLSTFSNCKKLMLLHFCIKQVLDQFSCLIDLYLWPSLSWGQNNLYAYTSAIDSANLMLLPLSEFIATIFLGFTPLSSNDVLKASFTCSPVQLWGM